MKRHQLLIYHQMSRRVRNVALLIFLVVAVMGVYDQYEPFLGDDWILWWPAVALFFAVWAYYALLVPRSAVLVRPDCLRVQGPIRGIDISYAGVRTVTSTDISHHYGREKLSNNERQLLEPLRQKTALLVELKRWPKSLRWARLWFPRLLLSGTGPGLLLIVDDWLALSQDVEVARDRWRSVHHAQRRGDNRSLAARILEN